MGQLASHIQQQRDLAPMMGKEEEQEQDPDGQELAGLGWGMGTGVRWIKKDTHLWKPMDVN